MRSSPFTLPISDVDILYYTRREKRAKEAIRSNLYTLKGDKMNDKEKLADFLERFLPKIQDKEPEYIRECLRIMVERLGFDQFKVAVDNCKDPLQFGYNIYLWTQGMVKEVRNTGRLKAGKTRTEKNLSNGYGVPNFKKDERCRISKRMTEHNYCWL